MQISQRALAYMLLCAWVCGAALGVLYDGMLALLYPGKDMGARITRLKNKLLPPPALRLNLRPFANNKGATVVAVVERGALDILFCLLFAVTVILLLYETNDGQWRTSVPVVMLLSLALYRATLARPIRSLLAFGRTVLWALLAWVLGLFLYPIRRLLRRTQALRRRLVGRMRAIGNGLLEAIRERRRARADRRRQHKQKSALDENNKTPTARKPPNGKTVFAKGGYRIHN